MLVAIGIDLKISANPCKCPPPSPLLSYRTQSSTATPCPSPPLSTAHLCKPKTQPRAHTLALLPWEEEMGAAQEELGAAGPWSNLSGCGGGPFQGGYCVGQGSACLQAVSSGPPAYTEALTKVDRYAPVSKQVTGSYLHTEGFSRAQFP